MDAGCRQRQHLAERFCLLRARAWQYALRPLQLGSGLTCGGLSLLPHLRRVNETQAVGEHPNKGKRTKAEARAESALPGT
jgi:hypothetical protein